MKIVVVDFECSEVEFDEVEFGSMREYYEDMKRRGEDEGVEFCERDDGDEIVGRDYGWDRVEWIYKEIKNSN